MQKSTLGEAQVVIELQYISLPCVGTKCAPRDGQAIEGGREGQNHPLRQQRVLRAGNYDIDLNSSLTPPTF